MQTHMRIPIPYDVRTLIARVEQAGFEAVIVGGCVRDALLGKPCADYDLAVSSSPEETCAIFSDRKLALNGLKHGTVTVIYRGKGYEVTSYRIDSGYTDSRHPDSVTFTRSLRDDLARRDFTVNAMAYSDRLGLRDPFGGRADLAAKLIRCVGEPDRRFEEDALRIMRALRFSSTLGFEIDGPTADALSRHAEELPLIAAERVAAELFKLVAGRGAAEVLGRFSDIFTGLLPMLRINGETLAAVSRADALPSARLALLLPTEEAALAFCAALKLSKQTRLEITTLLAAKYEPCHTVRADVRHFLASLDPKFDYSLYYSMQRALLAQDAEAAEKVAESIIASGECVRQSQLAVNGKDMAELGFSGKEIGQALASLFELVLSGHMPNEREALLAAARLIKV